MVNDFDVEKALVVLKDIDDTPYTNEKEEAIECPNCQSTELYADFKSMKNPAGVIAAITSFILTIFPFYYKSVYRCKKCSTEFTLKKK